MKPTDKELRNILGRKPGQLTTDDLQKLRPHDVEKLTLFQVSKLTPRHFAAMKPKQVAGLTQEQVAVLSLEQMGLAPIRSKKRQAKPAEEQKTPFGTNTFQIIMAGLFFAILPLWKIIRSLSY